MSSAAPSGYAVVVTAAGRGTRARTKGPKQWEDLAGHVLLDHTLRCFKGFGQVVLVVHPDDMGLALQHFAGEVVIVSGGESRSASVLAGLTALEGQASHVLIHDGARPMVSAKVINGVTAALKGGAIAAAPALPVTDTLWQGSDGQVEQIVPREGLFRAQTPQGFRLAEILAAHRSFPEGASDDVALAIKMGHKVTITAGDENNIKITWPADFGRAERIMGKHMDIRTGNGFDVHACTNGDHVWLCGVRIDHDCGLKGHSDADVGMHALTDAIYGALAEGDIGRHFPPSDPQWKGAASEIFLRHACDLVSKRGYRVGNVDVTLICETPRIGPHAGKMQNRLSKIMSLAPARISVKATTSEQLGFTGRGEGIAAIANATLIQD